jgi:hypothetical protein
MFTLLGLLLAIFGLFSNKAIYDRSQGININLSWGVALLAFGAVMWALGRRGTSAIRPSLENPEGRTIEEIEHRRGLEREPNRSGH